MPLAPLRPCLGHGCRALVRKGYCPACGTVREQRRGSAHARGYGSRWQKLSRWFRDEHPYCGDREDGQPDTGDSQCRTEGRYTTGTRRAPHEVDHVRPVTGRDDPMFFDVNALQTLCRTCHARKRQQESRG